MRHDVSSKRLDVWLSRRERDGLTWAELSRVSGIPVWTLRYRDRRRSTEASSPFRSRRRFLSVEIADREVPAGLELVTPSGLRVLVPPDFDADHLRRILEALGLPC